jgi:antitoxin VapB
MVVLRCHTGVRDATRMLQAPDLAIIRPQEDFRAILPRKMALNIKDPTADRLVRELAAATGESITTAVTVAVQERIERVRGAAPAELRKQELTRIALRAAKRRVLDPRSPDEILGYDEHGLPT